MSSRSAYRGRFAPSPTGPLHLGSMVAALASWLDARYHGGAWMIRIEDIDPPREVAGAADAQLQTLAAFGLHSDEPVMWQSARHAAYDAALATLRDRDLVFECSCSRSDLAVSNGIHHGCVPSPSGQRTALRLHAPDTTIQFVDRIYGRQWQNIRQTVGDVVLRRADGLYAYQLAVVVDDAAQGVTDVVRGADLLDSTARQIALQQALGLPTPRYMHVPLMLDETGEKLSKSQGAKRICDDDPLSALASAWRFLQQDQPTPQSTRTADWLKQAAALYLPKAMRPRSETSALY